MPYIKVGRRIDLMPIAIRLGLEAVTEGELNYVITKTIMAYLAARHTSYKSLNEVMGVIECVKQEFYRRVVVPYEETKREENGDVYE